MPRAIEFVLILLVLTAALRDVRTGRIPNWLTVPAGALGLALHAWYEGLPGVWTSIAGAALGLAAFILFFAAGGMGAGDVKLFGAVGALVGPQSLVLVFVFTGLLGGILAAAVAVRRRQFQTTLPYGPVIAGGTLITLLCSVIKY
jgi:prepilin peptidase CpaA